MSSSTPIVYYDIASKKPHRTFAANPWKTRLALNYKGVQYETRCIQMPDITAVREKLGIAANRTLPDGSPYHTLPVIHDLAKNELLGDSFEIALYLDTAYPDGPSLFRPQTVGLTAAFNAQIDGIFTKYVLLCSQMPFDPSVQEAIAAMFAARAKSMYVEMEQPEDQREKMMEAFEAALGELAKAYRHTGGTTDYFWLAKGTDQAQRQRPAAGREQALPFLDGEQPVYSDFIVGAWLKMFEACMPEQDWSRVRSWQGGMWGRLVNALQQWSEIK